MQVYTLSALQTSLTTASNGTLTKMPQSSFSWTEGNAAAQTLFNTTANSSQVVPVWIQAAVGISALQLVPEISETFSSNCSACGFSSDDLHFNAVDFVQSEATTYRDDHPLMNP